MFLYNLTLQKGGGINRAVVGNFSAPKAHEIVVARNKTVPMTVSLHGVRHHPELAAFGGRNRITSRSGAIPTRRDRRYDAEADALEKCTRRRSEKGVRRIVPGQHLVVDPKGRALMTRWRRPSSCACSAATPPRGSSVRRGEQVASSPAVTALGRRLEEQVTAIDLDYSADADSTGRLPRAQAHLLRAVRLSHGPPPSEPIDNGANLLIPIPGNGQPRRRARVRGER